MIAVSPAVSYLPGTAHPLSAEVGIIRAGDRTWLYDVGDDPRTVPLLPPADVVVLSHFHRDHTGNLPLLSPQTVYVSCETQRHVGTGVVVAQELYLDDLHLFPLPSSHCRGCLGLEVTETYAFVGDALYGKGRDGCAVFNVQLLQAQIAVLRRLRAPYLLVSHREGMIRSRREVLEELENLYDLRQPDCPEILI